MRCGIHRAGGRWLLGSRWVGWCVCRWRLQAKVARRLICRISLTAFTGRTVPAAATIRDWDWRSQRRGWRLWAGRLASKAVQDRAVPSGLRFRPRQHLKWLDEDRPLGILRRWFDIQEII